MSTSRLRLPLLLLLASALTVEATAPPPKWRPRTRLDFVLLEWEKANDAVKTATYRFKRTEKDRTFGTETSTTGDVRLVKPGWLRVEYHGRTPEFLLYTPKHLHYFRGDTKEENVFPRPDIRPFLGDPKGPTDFFSRINQAVIHDWYWLYTGPRPGDITRHFDLAIHKEDKWYIYLDAKPSSHAAKNWVKRTRIVLTKREHRVRQLWGELANGNETLLDIEDFNPWVKLTGASLREGLTRGWKRIELEGSWPDPNKRVEKALEQEPKKDR